jgi:hypothetical protein
MWMKRQFFVPTDRLRIWIKCQFFGSQKSETAFRDLALNMPMKA